MQKDVIVVLGSGISSSGTLLPKGQKRVEKAVELYNDGTAERLIMSGCFSWHRDDVPPKTEAEAMKDCAVSLGVPSENVLMENHSKDTLGNVFFTKLQFLEEHGWYNIAVVTSDYHKDRVAFLCQKILGSDYSTEVIGVDAELSADEREERMKHEQNKLMYIKECLNDIADGDHNQIANMILHEHPGYRDDPEVRVLLK